MNKEDLLFQIAERQQGYFTASQARDCGYYDQHFSRYLTSGAWIKVDRGLYRLARYPVAERPDLVEWSFWSRNKRGEVQGVWSHETALDLYEICDVMPAKLHMTVPKKFRKRVASPSILKLYFADLTEEDWADHFGYRVTTFIRTLFDLATSGQLSRDLLAQAVHEGRKKGVLLKTHIACLPLGKATRLLKDLYDESISI